MDRHDELNPEAAAASTSPAEQTSLLSPEHEHEVALDKKPLLSGDRLVALMIALGVLMAAAGWLYHYESRRVPQTFWGFESPKIFRESSEVSAMLIRPEEVGSAEKPAFYDALFNIDELRYVTLVKKDIAKDPNLPQLRSLLNDYSNYDSIPTTWSQPLWRYAVEFHFKSTDPEVPGDYTAVIVFDSECKFGRPQSVGKVISTEAMSAELLAYFESVFPEAKELKGTSATNIFARPLVAPEETPTATATGTGPDGSQIISTDQDVVTTPSPTPGATPTSTVVVPSTFGPSMPDFTKPVTPPPTAFAPPPVPSATPSATVAAVTTKTDAGPGVKAPPVTVGPGVMPAIPGLPGMPSVGGPLGPMLPGAPQTININPGGPLNTPPTSLPGMAPPSAPGGFNFTPPSSITVPPLKVVPAPK